MTKPPRPPRLILVGMMGSGKSTVGRLLGAATGWPYLDNDELLVAATGKSARAVAAVGEDELRAAEAAALRTGLAGPEPIIVGAAAGTILDAANRAALADAGVVVWLRARPATLARRTAGSTHRPWLDGDPLAWFTRTIRERAPLYESVAEVTVDVDEIEPREVARRVVASEPVRRTLHHPHPDLDSPAYG